jgi:hypothetical protein
MLLITGHPRSGTAYMAKLFRANGYRIGHEKLGKDGTSNWQQAAKADFYEWGERIPTKGMIEWSEIIYVMRNPIDLVNSVAFTEQPSQEFRRRFYEPSDNIFEDAIRSIIAWNWMIDEMQPTKTIKLEFAPMYFNFHRDVQRQNKRPHYSVTKDQLQHLVSCADFDMFCRIEKKYLFL